MVEDQQVKLTEDSMKMSGGSVSDYKLIIKTSEGTIRTSFLEVKEFFGMVNISILEKKTIVYGINDIIE